MSRQATSVGLLAQNEAWTELVAGALVQGGYRCARFQRADSLATYMRIAPTHILLLDPHPHEVSVLDVARYFRAIPAAFPLFKMIALTRVNAGFHQPFIESGLDAVVRKPAGHADLLLCVEEQRMLLQRHRSS